MLIGYARTSRQEEFREEQLQVLKQAGCQRIFADEIAGHKFEQPGLDAALAAMKPGDTLIIWRLDRLGRSLTEVLKTIQAVHRAGSGLRSVQDEIDTTQPEGHHQVRVFIALEQCQRNLIRQRTQSGLQAARARGRKGGRKRTMTPEKVQLAAKLMKDPLFNVQDICQELAIARATLYRYVSPDGEIRIE